MENTKEREPPNVITSDTSNATKLQPKEAKPKDSAKFRRFRAYNRGTWNGPKRENKEVVHRQDNLHRYDCLSSSLSLTDHQKSKGRTILDQLPLGKLGRPIDDVIFGICVVVANEDVRNGSRYYPNPEAAGDVQFEKVAGSLGLDRSAQLSIIETVRKKYNN